MTPTNNIDLEQINFKHPKFWAYFLSTNYPCAYDEEADCGMYDFIKEVLPIDTAWSDEFTQYYDGVMEESDGYLEEPTTFITALDDSEILKIEFHPGDTIFYLNDQKIGCTGPHWKLWEIPYQRVKSLLSLENGALLFQLLLPMAVLQPEETAELKPILQKQFLELGFTPPILSQMIDCLISGLVRQES